MSSYIIEEVDTSAVPECELSEFVETDEIPIVNSDDLKNYSDSEGLPSNFNDSSDETEDDFDRASKSSEPYPSTSHEKTRKRKPKISGKSKSVFVKKFINKEISYDEYARNMGSVDEDENYEDDSDGDESDGSEDTIMGKIKQQGKRHAIKAETHHAKKTKRALPPALQGLMGQANLCYVKGDSEMAEKLCLEIIRQEPTASEPYLTMAQIYENSDDEKYQELLLIAAHVTSTVFQWLHVAEIFLEKTNLKKASFCYAKATRCDPKDLSIRMKRLEILEKLGDHKHVLHCTYCMLGFIPASQHEFLIERAKWVAQQYHQEGLVTKSLDAMLKAYKKVPEHFTTQDVHSLIELLIKNKQYYKCLSVLIAHTGMSVKVKQREKEKYEFSDIHIPEDMLMDLRTKMCICLIRMKAFNLNDFLADNLLKFVDSEDGWDCYFDVAEAFMDLLQFDHALKILNVLVKTKNGSLPAIWLKHGESLRAVKKFDDAINSYKKVVSMSSHLEARLTLAALLKQEGRIDESLEVLSQNPELEQLEIDLLKEKCLLLRELGRIDEYLDDGYKMLLRHCVHLRSRHEVQIVSNFTKVSDRLNEIRNLRKNRNQEIDDVDAPQFAKCDNEPTVADDWKFFLDLVVTAFKHKRYVKLQRVTFAAMSSKRFHNYIREVDFIGVVACLFNREETYGYNKVREFLTSDKDKSRFWNLFNAIIHVTQDCRYYRFITRIFEKNTALNVPPTVYMVVANYNLMSNSYKHAMNHYDEIYKRFPSPLIALILSILYIQIAIQRYTSKKQQLIIQGLNYLQIYRDTREPAAEAEVLYNTGRFHHQIGQISVAKEYYEKALQVSNELITEHKELLDLRMEIAYNLHIIYKQSGNRTRARKMLYDNIVI